MPITKKSEAKEGGFAQVRAALVKFEGDVVSAEFGKWGGQGIGKDGKPLPPKEFFEITCENVEVLETTEELSIPITEYSFRINCSDYKGSFWVDMFLESVDKHKILIPDGLIGKRVIFEKRTLEASDPMYNSTNFVVAGIKDNKAPKAEAKASQDVPEDPMDIARKLAIGKTEAQFRTAIALHPAFVANPLLSSAKAGLLTQALVSEGKLVLVNGKYQLPS